MKKSVDVYYKQLQQATAENERLKEENKKIKKWLEKYKNANERLYDVQVDDFNFTKTKYKQALEDIREMSKKSADVFGCTGCYNIYNKINEVLKEN